MLVKWTLWFLRIHQFRHDIHLNGILGHHVLDAQDIWDISLGASLDHDGNSKKGHEDKAWNLRLPGYPMFGQILIFGYMKGVSVQMKTRSPWRIVTIRNLGPRITSHCCPLLLSFLDFYCQIQRMQPTLPDILSAQQNTCCSSKMLHEHGWRQQAKQLPPSKFGIYTVQALYQL